MYDLKIWQQEFLFCLDYFYYKIFVYTQISHTRVRPSWEFVYDNYPEKIGVWSGATLAAAVTAAVAAVAAATVVATDVVAAEAAAVAATATV